MRVGSDLGIRTQQTRIDILANNVANINTPGFKAGIVNFAEAFDDQERTANEAYFGGVPSGGSLGIGQGPLYSGKRVDFSQGTITESGNVWDLAILGEGFFQVADDDGLTSYTRAGTFEVDVNGQLVTKQGKPVQPSLNIPRDATEIQVKPDGKVLGKVPKDDDPTQREEKVLGQLVIAKFKNPNGLQLIGDNLYMGTESSGTAQTGTPGSGELGKVKPYAIEQSNVNLVDSMTNLIQAQRAYQMEARLLQQGDEMWAEANALRR